MWDPSPVPGVSWQTEFREEPASCKGTAACVIIGFIFIMTLGTIYWQVVDQPHKHWILTGRLSGLFWERMKRSLVLQTLAENKTFVEIHVGGVGDNELQIPLNLNLCWMNQTSSCYKWDSQLDVMFSLESDESSHTDCYSIMWAPAHCLYRVQHCFSMRHIQWYGGASVHAQRWPINTLNIPLQPFTAGNIRQNPSGFGSVLDHYFLGSTGVAVLLSPDVPLQIGIDRNNQLCVQPQSATVPRPLQYTVCVGQNIKAVHQKFVQQQNPSLPQLPNMSILRCPLLKMLVNVDSGVKLERELRTFSNRLKRHHIKEGIISLDERSTTLLLNMKHGHSNGKNGNLHLVRHLNISVTFSPYVSLNNKYFLRSLQEGREAYWLSRPTATHGHVVPLMSSWKGDICVKLNISHPAAVSWFLEQVGNWSSQLDAEYVMLEGAEGNFIDASSWEVAGNEYFKHLAGIAKHVGEKAIVTSGARSNDVPLFIMMSPLKGSWSYSGIKAIIPSILHYGILGYNFLIPDAIGGSLMEESDLDDELFVRWLEIVSFLPVLSFQTPPWFFNKDKILNLTRSYMALHHDFVIPLLLKYAQEWRSTRSPIYRPLWWISPEDPITFTIENEFLIGSEVLVAPVTERGAEQRNIYLPGVGLQWQDKRNGQVFDGGTLLQEYPVGLEEVAIFLRIYS